MSPSYILEGGGTNRHIMSASYTLEGGGTNRHIMSTSYTLEGGGTFRHIMSTSYILEGGGTNRHIMSTSYTLVGGGTFRHIKSKLNSCQSFPDSLCYRSVQSVCQAVYVLMVCFLMETEDASRKTYVPVLTMESTTNLDMCSK
jgi:hypothetical protein